MKLEWSISCLRAFFIFLLCSSLQARAGDDAAGNFEQMAAQVYRFNTDSFLYDRSIFEESPQQVTENDKRFALLVNETSKQQLETLLHHPDPKVRTLALAALFQKEDPQALPEIVTLANDNAETFLRPGGVSQNGTESPPQPQTVGMIATAMIKFYMEAAGYYYGIDGSNGYQPGFADYWQKRKGRKYCASWFAIQVERALRGGLPASRDKPSEMLPVRHCIDQLPPDDRAWTLLWLRDVYPDQDEFGPAYANILVSKEELIKILQELGPDKLLLKLQRQTVSDDPDMSPNSRKFQDYSVATLFLLEHAKDLFRPKDVEAIIAQGQWELDHPNKGFRTPWWWIAAAQIQPSRAGFILHQGYDSLQKADASEEDYPPLTVALWKSGGEKEVAFLSDWYFSSKPRTALFIHVNARVEFIDKLAKSAKPSDKKFLAHLLQDPRSGSIDPETLSHFARAVNGWLPAPIVTNQEITELNGFPGKGRSVTPQMIPGLLERLQESIPKWTS